jgi:hypothetical protein
VLDPTSCFHSKPKVFFPIRHSCTPSVGRGRGSCVVRDGHSGCPMPSRCVWPSRRCCWERVARITGCKCATAGWGVWFPYLPKQSGHHKRLTGAAPLVWPDDAITADPCARRGPTIRDCWMPPRCPAAGAGRRCTARRWPDERTTATARRVRAGAGAEAVPADHPRGCRPRVVWPTRNSANGRWPRSCSATVAISAPRTTG